MQPDAKPSLRELQDTVQEAILKSRKDSTGKHTENAKSLLKNDRLAVYAEGYIFRIAEALESVFPAVRKVIGESNFLHLTANYLDHYPSNSFDLGYAGVHLSKYLCEYVLAKDLPFLSDLAGLEWQVYRSFYAVDEKPLDSAVIRNIPAHQWPELTLTFQPSTAVRSSKWNIYDIWLARQEDDENFHVENIDQPSYALVFRNGYEVMVERISQTQHVLLKALIEGVSLGKACEALSASQDAPDLQTWFATWMQRGLITKAV